MVPSSPPVFALFNLSVGGLFHRPDFDVLGLIVAYTIQNDFKRSIVFDRGFRNCEIVNALGMVGDPIAALAPCSRFTGKFKPWISLRSSVLRLLS